jgi:hypothetical protein
MPRFVELDQNNIVVGHIQIASKNMLDSNGDESEAVGQQFIAKLTNKDGSKFKQCSIWVGHGNHYDYETGNVDWERGADAPVEGAGSGAKPALRYNSPDVGWSYSPEHDAFIRPKPFNSFVLDTELMDWKPPLPLPSDGKKYQWDEDSLSYIEAVPPQE